MTIDSYDELEHEFPGWHWWRGVGDAGWYARRELSSPPVVLRAESLDDLQNLLNILTAGQMRMSDDQRIHGIDKIYDHVKDKLNFLRNFNSSALVLTMQRSADNNDAQSIQKLYGL